jgi:subtilisin family serine protease
MSEIEAGNDITFDFDSEKAPVVVGDPGFEAGRMSWFSSWDPTLDARMKSGISAPGGDILSTWPVSGGSWAIHSGTSMATPYVSDATRAEEVS